MHPYNLNIICYQYCVYVVLGNANHNLNEMYVCKMLTVCLAIRIGTCRFIIRVFMKKSYDIPLPVNVDFIIAGSDIKYLNVI